jgi:hypothetical protein
LTDLEKLTAASFAVEDRFTLSTSSAGPLELVLAELEEFGPAPSGRNAFSLRFLGPLRPILPQAIYRLENAAIGPLEIFLVPLGPHQGGMRYEAVFT